MPTYSKASISNIKNTTTKMDKNLGNVYTYNGIYEAVVISASDIQKNGRLKVRLAQHNVNLSLIHI